MSKSGAGLAVGRDLDFEQEDIEMEDSEVASIVSPQPKAAKTQARGKTAVASNAKQDKSAAGVKGTASKKKAAEIRAPLTDISNLKTNGVDNEEQSQLENLSTGSPGVAKKEPTKKPRARKEKADDVPAKKPTSSAAAKVVTEEIPETQPEQQSSFDKRSIAETQAEPLDTATGGGFVRARPERRLSVSRPSRNLPRHRQRSVSRTRGRSASSDRGGNDPMLRRRLGEMTQKFEALELRYQSLKDVGVTEAENNFERFKKQVEENTKAGDALIATLRATIAAQGSLNTESGALRSQITTLSTQVETSKTEKKTLETSLEKSQAEVKTLQTKLAAARAPSVPVQPPSSSNGETKDATKSSHAPPRTVLVGSAEAAKEAQKRMLKEDMYGDLSGLIIRDVKRKEDEGEDVYDCIQTGRNGTLHFHLTVANPSAGSKTPGGASMASSYEDAEFTYTPFLDEKRDRSLMEILPDYLTEEICFPRNNAAKFYGRVVDCMTKRVEVVGGVDGDGEVMER